MAVFLSSLVSYLLKCYLGAGPFLGNTLISDTLCDQYCTVHKSLVPRRTMAKLYKVMDTEEPQTQEPDY